MKAKACILLGLGQLLASGATAQVQSNYFAQWTFESNPLPSSTSGSLIGPISPEVGQGQLRGFHANAGTAWSTTTAGNGSPRSLNANNWGRGDYFEFRVQAVPTGILGVNWHQRRSDTAPQQFSLQYSTNGTDFIQLTNYSVVINSWSSNSASSGIYSYNLTNFATATNASFDLIFRLVAESVAGSTAGTSRIDNVSVAAVANKYLVSIAGQQVEVERWGSGPKAVVFFSHTGNLAGIFRANAALVQSLVGEEYSAFTWTYPSGPPFDRVFTTLSDWRAGLVPPTGRLLFPGVASSMLAQLRAATGLQEFVLVGNSLGAGVVLSDYDTLAQDPDCTMLLISPTEPFIPPTLPEYLEGALMMSDPYSLAEEWLRRDEDRRFCLRNTTLPPPSYRSDPGHFTIFDAQDIAYAFDLLGYASKPRGSVVTVSPANTEALWGNGLKRIDWFAAFGPEQVKLELLKNGEPVKTLADSTFNSGRFDWQIPGDLVDGVDYSIRVSSLADPSNSGGDDLRFAIQTIPAGRAVDYTRVAWETESFARFNDAMGDVNVDGITNVGNGILDIVKMEITDTAEDIIFALTVGGDVAAAGWGNFMIGIANQKSLGTTNGNGWLRPIALDAGGGYGMTHWIGSWVDDGGGSQLWTREQTFWSGPASLKAFQVAPGAQSTLKYTVSKQSLGVTNGDLIIFDAYSSGSGPDGAIDALSNSNVTITSWGGSYISQARAGTTRTYKVGNSASITRQWFGQTNVSFDGMHALQSGLVNDNEVSYFQTTLQGPGTLNFDWRVSSESGADFLRFAIPGVSDAISGHGLPWQRKSFEIPAGPVLVRWTYEKNGGTTQFVQGTLDAGWIDNISYVPALVEGLPGLWWMEYFGTTDNVSASADADGDGFTNAQEYALGTIPTDPNSTFRLRAVSTEPSGAITISWDAVAGKTYQLVATGDLAASPWQPVGEPVSASTSGPVSRSDSPAQPARFYRVILVP